MNRHDMIMALLDNDGYSNNYNSYSLAYNVKTSNADLGWENIVKLFRASGYDEFTKEPGALEFCSKLYTDHVINILDHAIEDARRHVYEDEYFREVDDKTFDVKFSFAGRGGGWLVVESFNGNPLPQFEDEYEDYTAEEIHVLYVLAFKWEKAFTQRNACRVIEEKAAFSFFINICEHKWDEARELIAALRTVEDAIDSKHAMKALYVLADTLEIVH